MENESTENTESIVVEERTEDSLLRQALERRLLDPATPAADLVPLSQALQHVTHDEILQASGVTAVRFVMLATRALELWSKREEEDMERQRERHIMQRAEFDEFMKFRRDNRKVAKAGAKKRVSKKKPIA